MHKGGYMLCNKYFGRPGKNISLLIILIILILFISLNACSSSTSAGERSKEGAGNVSFTMEPFVLNLENHGDPKFIKVTLALELANASLLEMVKAKQPALRDAIIAIVSSKSADEFLSQEGKMQFKDELILSINQALKKQGAVKNVYFTELIVQ